MRKFCFFMLIFAFTLAIICFVVSVYSFICLKTYNGFYMLALGICNILNSFIFYRGYKVL